MASDRYSTFWPKSNQTFCLSLLLFHFSFNLNVLKYLILNVHFKIQDVVLYLTWLRNMVTS